MHCRHGDNLSHGLDGAPGRNCKRKRLVRLGMFQNGTLGIASLTPGSIENLCAGSIGSGSELADESLVRQDVAVDVDLRSRCKPLMERRRNSTMSGLPDTHR